jgi:hypothetical protein
MGRTANIGPIYAADEGSANRWVGVVTLEQTRLYFALAAWLSRLRICLNEEMILLQKEM